MEEMRTNIPKLNMAYYVNQKTIAAVHGALNIPVPRAADPAGGGGGGATLSNGFRPGSPAEEEEGEEVEEDVIDDDYA